MRICRPVTKDDVGRAGVSHRLSAGRVPRCDATAEVRAGLEREAAADSGRSSFGIGPDVATLHSSVDVDVVVIGAGQAGLSAAYFLNQAGLEPETGYVLLDACTRKLAAPGSTAGRR